MEPKLFLSEGDGFAKLLRKLLSRQKDGAIIISKQDGKVLHLTLNETHADLRGCTEQASQGAGEKTVTRISDGELKTLLKFIACVKYGTVIVKIQNSKIAGVEKNEKIKF